MAENLERIAVIGLSAYVLKLLIFVVASALAALGGPTYALVVGGASPHEASSDLTLSLIVMAVFFSTVMTLLFKARDRVLVWQKGVMRW